MALDRDKQEGDISHHLFSLVAELNGYLLVARDDGVDIYRYFGEKNTSLDDTREVRSKWDKEKVLVILVLRFFGKIFCFLVFLGGCIKVFKVLA